MTAPPQPPLLDQPHRNHGLFSDYYLNETLPRRSDWRELLGDAELVMEQIKTIFEGYNPTPNEKEAQTEEDWVRPVLRALGHTDLAVQPSLKVPGNSQAPDYVFYRDQASKDANAAHKLLDDKLLESKAYAVGDAKRWDRRLDVPLKEAPTRSTTRTPPTRFPSTCSTAAWSGAS